MDLFTLSASLGLDITNFEGGVNAARRLLLQFAGAVVDFGQDVIETGMGFDKQMSAVEAVADLGKATRDNFLATKRLREEALEQARDSIFTAEEVATAYYYMGMAGWDAEQMIAGLPGVISLAAASGEDLKMTSDMVTDSLTAFGLGAGQAAHFADVLAVTATNANTDVARMQQTFKNLAPIAGALSYSIEDVALSVGLIANAGVKGSQAGTALRNIFTRIATNAGQTAKDLGALQVVVDELGVSFYSAEGRARPWGEVLNDMREAWRKLDPSKVDEVTAAFGEFSAESQSADEIMAEFANDLDTWTTEWNSLTTAVEREEFVSKLESQFAALGISMRGSNGNLREFNQVAQDARIKLGGLTDQEQIYYGKQIGSLRGISGLLALMTASEDDVNKLAEAIRNADGAAQAMADTRLDNLWGDIKLFNAELDVLKIALYDDVKSPLRDLVQYATSAIKNITDAINENGLLGGIQQLGAEIRKFGIEYQDEIAEFTRNLVPILTTIVDAIAPAFVEATARLGMAFGQGIIQGLGDSMRNSGNPWADFLAHVFIPNESDPVTDLSGTRVKSVGIKDIGIPLGQGITEGVEQEVGGNDEDWLFNLLHNTIGFGWIDKLSNEFSAKAEENPVYIPLKPLVDRDQIQDALDRAVADGQDEIILDGISFDIDTPVDIIIQTLEEAGNVGGAALAQNIYDGIDEASQAAGILVTTDLTNAGVDGGSAMASSVLGAISDESSNITNTVYNSISAAGSDAGTSVANSIQNALSVRQFFVNVTGWVKTLFGVNKNASAMSSGKIYNTPTIFGYANGAFQIAGDSGPEAVVGVHSLRDMINNAISNALGREIVVPRVDNSSSSTTIILEVDGVRFAKAVYKANKRESKRIGAKLVEVDG